LKEKDISRELLKKSFMIPEEEHPLPELSSETPIDINLDQNSSSHLKDFIPANTYFVEKKPKLP
jgi:hypothetical protein